MEPAEEDYHVLRELSEFEKDIANALSSTLNDSTVQKVENELTSSASWSIPEIAWYEAMMESYPNEIDSVQQVFSTPDSTDTKAIAYQEKENTPILCQGQGDGFDSPIYFYTPTSSFESFEQKQLQQCFSPLIANTLDKNQQLQNSIPPATSESASSVNYQTPNRFDTQARTFGSDKINLPPGQPTKIHKTSGPYGIYTYRSSRGRRSGSSRSNLEWLPEQRSALKPPHITKLRTSNSSAAGAPNSSYSTASDTEATSSFSSYNNTTTDASDISLADSETSPIYPKVPNNTPDSAHSSLSSNAAVSFGNRDVASQPCGIIPSQLSSKLQLWTNFSGSDVRESHNAKERQRRSRIRDACNLLRQSVPTVNERTDNATVFEDALEYMIFLKNISQGRFDDEFARLRFEEKKRE